MASAISSQPLKHEFKLNVDKIPKIELEYKEKKSSRSSSHTPWDQELLKYVLFKRVEYKVQVPSTWQFEISS